jgi:hypothetical protein
VTSRDGGSTRWAVKGTDVSMVSAAVESEIGRTRGRGQRGGGGQSRPWRRLARFLDVMEGR